MRPLVAPLVLLALLLAGCGGASDDGSGDRDGDGLSDAGEAAGWRITIDLATGRVGRVVTSDPDAFDTDADGLADYFEAALGRDPRSPDTDEDGLTDCEEDRHAVRAECEDPAFAGPFDGGLPTDGSRADSDPGQGRYVNLVRGHPDATGTLDGPLPYGDGVPDALEMRGYSVRLWDGRVREVRTDPMARDSDGDGLEDGEEAYQFQSDPTVADSDGDGCADGLDLFPEADVRLQPRLGNLTWTANTPARLAVRVVVDGVPGEAAGEVAVQPGQTVDLSTLAFPARAAGCSHLPWQGWVGATAQLVWKDHPDGARLLTGGPAAASPRDGRVAADIVGAEAQAGPARAERAEAAWTWQVLPVLPDGRPFLGGIQGA
ncbi:MAG: hypothetical protein QOD77_1961 [Thermoplasmata archaeon]|jgi:hypothetical protein|nr:hypothetical protein [Thermoplasmata archaeon]